MQFYNYYWSLYFMPTNEQDRLYWTYFIINECKYYSYYRSLFVISYLIVGIYESVHMLKQTMLKWKRHNIMNISYDTFMQILLWLLISLL